MQRYGNLIEFNFSAFVLPITNQHVRSFTVVTTSERRTQHQFGIVPKRNLSSELSELASCLTHGQHVDHT